MQTVPLAFLSRLLFSHSLFHFYHGTLWMLYAFVASGIGCYVYGHAISLCRMQPKYMCYRIKPFSLLRITHRFTSKKNMIKNISSRTHALMATRCMYMLTCSSSVFLRSRMNMCATRDIIIARKLPEFSFILFKMVDHCIV
jgi:hypothetical protein